jgi:hypothetical protein
MTREEFIEELKERGYSYEIEGNKIVVTHKGTVYLSSLTSLPPGVEFRNRGDAYLPSLTSISSDVKFNNEGYVNLSSLTSLPPGVEFRNEGWWINLESLTSLPPGVEFRNEGWWINLESLTGGTFDEWIGNIEGIDSQRLLNKMISLGLFERRR